MIVYGDAVEVPNVVIDYEKCDTCINCLRTCPMQVLKIENKRVVQAAELCFKSKRKSGIGYNPLVAFPPFERLAPDKERLLKKGA